MHMTMYLQFCPLARAAEIVGERWTLLIFRELLISPARFSDLARKLAPITSAVLSDRLRELEARGLTAREEVGPPTPARLFVLTPAGRAIEPAVQALVRWGTQFLLPVREGEVLDPEWACAGLAAYARFEPTPAIAVELQILAQGKEARVLVTGGPEGTFVGSKAQTPGAVVRGELLDLLSVVAGELPVRDASASGLLEVDGDLDSAARLPELFDFRGEEPGRIRRWQRLP
jgi:DNA-binding HxlR family transcriptional regulator